MDGFHVTLDRSKAKVVSLDGRRPPTPAEREFVIDVMEDASAQAIVEAGASVSCRHLRLVKDD